MTVAVCCCGPLCFSQDGAFDSKSEPSFTPIDVAGEMAIPNPFEFSDEAVSPSDSLPTVDSPQAELSESADGLSTSEIELSTTAPDPGSLPVNRQPSQSSEGELLGSESLMNTPHAAYEPVEWCPTVATPNPVAEVMLRQFCVDGLWDGYAAQRARVCMHQWRCIAGHGCGCPHCSPAGCPPTACGYGLGSGKAVGNRYAHSQTHRSCQGDCTAGHSGQWAQ